MTRNARPGGRRPDRAFLFFLLALALAGGVDAAPSRGIQRIIRNPSPDASD
jgi:hypothetical protein